MRTVWNENVWVTTSGTFSMPPFTYALHAVKRDRILYSVDYPFDSNVGGKKYIEMIEKSDYDTTCVFVKSMLFICKIH